MMTVMREMTQEQIIAWLIDNGVSESTAQEVADDGIVPTLQDAEAILPAIKG
jgi:hypothetical protein